MKKAFKFTGTHPIYATLGDGTDVCFAPGEVYQELPEGNEYVECLKLKGVFEEIEIKTKTTKDNG